MAHIVFLEGEAQQQLAVLTGSPQQVRHRRTPSRDLEDAALFLTSPRYRQLSLSEQTEAEEESPPVTPRTPRPLRLLSPAGAAALPALVPRKLHSPSCSARRCLYCVAVLVVCLVLLFEWGIGSPSHVECRAARFSAADTTPRVVSFCDGATQRFATPVLRANDVQVLGTHNSYHVQPWPLALSSAWRYTHESLTAQLNGGARSLELDVHWDPLLHSWSVYHEPFVDSSSVCGCLAECLVEVRRWSDAHPGHTMLTIVVEPKFNIDAINPFRHGATGPLKALQAVVLHVLPHALLLTPSAVQGDAPTLRAALSACGWPSANETRGGLMLVLDVWDENAAAGDALRNLPLPERLFFLRATESDPLFVPDDAAVVEPEECSCAYGFDEVSCTAAYRALVAAGYLVRASVGTAMCAPHEAKLRSAAAAAAGVQLMTTDYLSDAALPCGGDFAACCVPERSSGAPCDLQPLRRPLGQQQQ